MRRIFKWLLVGLWMLVIFLFSNENGVTSSSRSRRFIESGIEIVEKLFNIEISNQDKFIDEIHFGVRKLAHFVIYFILGVLVVFCFYEYNLNVKKLIIYSILFCFSYSLMDEFHQLFISGRSGQFIDSLVDTFGSLTGILIFFRKYY